MAIDRPNVAKILRQKFEFFIGEAHFVLKCYKMAIDRPNVAKILRQKNLNFLLVKLISTKNG